MPKYEIYIELTGQRKYIVDLEDVDVPTEDIINQLKSGKLDVKDVFNLDWANAQYEYELETLEEKDNGQVVIYDENYNNIIIN